MPTMPSILPPELLSAICGQISSKEDLKNLALCSKELYDIATPHLYRNLDLDLGLLPELEHRIGLTRDDLKYKNILRPLVKLFRQKPKLAGYVRALSNRRNFDDGPTWLPKKPEEPVSGRIHDTEIEEAIRHVCVSEKDAESWIEESYLPYNEDESAIMALLISCLPGLESLDLEVFNHPQRVLHVLGLIGQAEKPFDSPNAFQKFHRACWGANQEKYGAYMCPELFLIQSMREVYMSRIGTGIEDAVGDNKDGYCSALEPDSSNVELIQLCDSLLTESELNCILTAPRALKTFIYEIGFISPAKQGCSLAELREALNKQKSTLEFLWLTGHDDCVPWMTEFYDIPPMESLEDFTKLRGLRLAVDFVFGVDGSSEDPNTTQTSLYELLPRQLEVLHLEYCGQQIDNNLLPSLRYLMEQKRNPDILPRLTKLRLSIIPKGAEEHYQTLAELQELAESVGMEMTLIDYPVGKRDDRTLEFGCGWDEDVVWRTSSCAGMLPRAPPVMLELKDGSVTEVPM